MSEAAHCLHEDLRVSGQYILDTSGRVVTLRGFSVAGSCKLPAKPDLPTHSPDVDAFFEHRDVSFVGRPFPLDEADMHLARLRDWGATFVRLLVPWEALEHGGPGRYDKEYIAYLRALIDKMPGYGIKCIIDAHQDVWSRLCGGSGAPGWTLELAGFDLRKMHNCCAAFLHAEHLDPVEFRKGAWPTGYQKLAAATMFTLFWTGDIHAPLTKIPINEHADGVRLFPGQSSVGIGTFLRRAHSAAYAHLAAAIRACEAVVGFEPMNEPHRGYLSLHSFDSFDALTDLHFGRVPSALQSLALGEGYSVQVPVYVRSFPDPTRIQRFERLTPPSSCWRAGCIWRKHRVWDWNEQKKLPMPLRRAYFSKDPQTGRTLDFYADCWQPFIQEFAEAVHVVKGSWLIFAGAIPGELRPLWPKDLQPRHFVMAPHFYDLHVLFMKYLGNISINVQGLAQGLFVLKALYLGRQGRQDNYRLQLGNVVRNALSSTSAPCFIGETGLPYDINGFHQSRSRDFRWHEQGLDGIMSAIEQVSPAVGTAIWCYDPVNTSRWGDGWMGEDFSCISQDAFESRFRFKDGGQGGARCLDAVQRPYATRTAGIPLEQRFDMHTLAFSYRHRNARPDDRLAMPATRTSLFYLPKRRYNGRELQVQLSDGSYTFDPETQTLSWTHSNTAAGGEHWLRLCVVGEPDRQTPLNVNLSLTAIVALLSGLSALLAALFAVYAVNWRGVVQ